MRGQGRDGVTNEYTIGVCSGMSNGFLLETGVNYKNLTSM